MNATHRHFSTNTKGRDFVVGDIHGELEMLKSELVKVGFDHSKDRLFSVGDMVDRGHKWPTSASLTPGLYLAAN